MPRISRRLERVRVSEMMSRRMERGGGYVDTVKTGEGDVGVGAGVVPSASRLRLVKFSECLVERVPRLSFGIVFAEVLGVCEGSNGATDAHPRFVAGLVVPVAQVEVN